MDNKYRILIIDDNIKQLNLSIVEPLERLGHTITQEASPGDGIILANNRYDFIFIDHRFGNSLDYTGSIIGMKIRQKCPLVPLVLITSYGAESIREFIHVGFDDYFDKKIPGENSEDVIKRFKDCLDSAKTNSQRRIKSEFKDEELTSIKNRLDAVEYALSINKVNRNVSNIAPKVFAYEKEHFQSTEESLTPNALHITFKLREKGILAEGALKTRQLLISYPDMWPETRKSFSPVEKIIKEFLIGE